MEREFCLFNSIDLGVHCVVIRCSEVYFFEIRFFEDSSTQVTVSKNTSHQVRICKISFLNIAISKFCFFDLESAERTHIEKTILKRK
jgi:hypothetical protein